MIALAKSPSSAVFWLETLDLSRPRDAFAQTRRTYALAALALIACRTDASAGFEALLKAAAHANPQVRAMATLYLGRACSESGGDLPAEAKAVLMDIARNDAAFGPRYQARLALQAAGDGAPLDHPGEVFLFRVCLRGNLQAYRTIAVKSEQTLAHLHDGIQRAFNWDADHLYSFFLNGKLHDWRYAVACPYEEEAMQFADEAIIGNLGLATKHKFLYFFDYGDCHEFDVQMVGVEAKAKRAQYPSVAESHGKAPGQYRW